jgi:hypothetical protein
MSSKQGDPALLQHPVAQVLLHSSIPARFAYTWTDGTPRVVPVWFHWTGDEFVFGTPTTAPKVKALKQHPEVALTIDEGKFPCRVLLVRGTAQLQELNGVVRSTRRPPDAIWEINRGPDGRPRPGSCSPGWYELPFSRNGLQSWISRSGSQAQLKTR